jgi:hypothetical protein
LKVLGGRAIKRKSRVSETIGRGLIGSLLEKADVTGPAPGREAKLTGAIDTDSGSDERQFTAKPIS